jgi:hypothetical protein
LKTTEEPGSKEPGSEEPGSKEAGGAEIIYISKPGLGKLGIEKQLLVIGGYSPCFRYNTPI